MVLYCTSAGWSTSNQRKEWKASSLGTSSCKNDLTFLVSGLIHELIFWCAAETDTSFFVFQGLCTALEVGYRRSSLSRYIKSPRFIVIPVLFIFLFKTVIWLLFPTFTRSGAHVEAIAEYDLLMNYFFTASVQNKIENLPRMLFTWLLNYFVNISAMFYGVCVLTFYGVTNFSLMENWWMARRNLYFLGCRPSD